MAAEAADAWTLTEVLLVSERLYKQAGRHGDAQALRQAVDLLRPKIAAIEPRHPSYLPVCLQLARCLSRLYRLADERAALDEAAGILRRAVRSGGGEPSILTMCLNNLGNTLMDLYGLTRDGAVLAEAEAALREACARLVPADPFAGTVRSALGDVCLEHYWATNQVPYLDEAISLARQAAAAMAASDPGYPVMATNLANALTEHYERTREPQSLEEAERILRAALVGPDTDPADRALLLSSLGMTLEYRHTGTGDLAALTEAEARKREAVDITPAGAPARAGYLNDLGATLSARYQATGNTDALDEAIGAYRAAVAALQERHTGYPGFLANLGNTLTDRYIRLGDSPALDEAVGAFRRATRLVGTADPRRAVCWTGLGRALALRHRRVGGDALLAAAEHAYRQALEAVSETDLQRPLLLSNLAAVLRDRYRGSGDANALDEAEQLLREALGSSAADQPSRVKCLANLANVLLDRHERTGEAVWLDDAIALLGEAVRLADGGRHDATQLLANLGAALRKRYDLSPSQRLLDEAVAAFDAVARMETASPYLRARSARSCAQLHASAGHWLASAAAYRLAVDLVPPVASLALRRADREGALARFVQLSSDAAAAALEAGDPLGAVEILERGRGVLVTQALRLRADLGQLWRTAPALARRFEALRDELGREAGPPPDAPDDDHPDWRVLAAADDIARQTRTAAAWDSLVEEVRAVGGDLADFLRPPTSADVLAAAGDGPVAVVNVSLHRSDVIVLASGRIEVIPLPLATPKAVGEQVVALFEAVPIALARTSGMEERAAAERALLRVLEWLWEAIARPVLDAIGEAHDRLRSTRDGGRRQELPRLWWVPTGILTFLPIHAAGRHTDETASPRPTVLDRVVSSYAPTVLALGRGRRHRDRVSTPPRTLVVSMPETPGLDDLESAREEGRLVGQLAPRTILLTGGDATRRRVLDLISTCDGFHFAGHAAVDISDPSASRLLLHDHHDAPLTVLDIARLRHPAADLAVLAGCETVLTGLGAMDETINLATAFQLAGYRHVVANLWGIFGNWPAELAERVWQARSSFGGTERTAFAVHAHAVEMRDRFRRIPSHWAASIHLGP